MRHLISVECNHDCISKRCIEANTDDENLIYRRHAYKFDRRRSTNYIGVVAAIVGIVIR